MSKARSLLMILRGQMVAWLHSPRSLISGLVILSLTYMNACSYVSQLEANELYAHFGETAFYFLSSGFGNISLVSAMLLVMMSEVPRRAAYQNMMLIRSNRMRWLLAQVLFCLVATGLMIGLMLIVSMTMTWQQLQPGGGWSDLERIAVDAEAAWMIQLVPEYVRCISPLGASLIAMVILFEFWFTMVLIILFCSLLGHPNTGLILYVSFLVLDVTVLWEQLPGWMQNMPASFATMNSIANKYPNHEFKSMVIVIISYFAMDIFFVLCMYAQTRRIDLFFSGKDVA